LNAKTSILVYCYAENGAFGDIYTEYLTIKWTNDRFMYEKVGSNNIAWPPPEKVGGRL